MKALLLMAAVCTAGEIRLPVESCELHCAYLEMGYEEAEQAVKELGCDCAWYPDGSQETN